jgi:hypothetical protein
MWGIEPTNGLVLYLHTPIRSLYFYKKVDKVIVRSLKLKLKFENKLMIFELTSQHPPTVTSHYLVVDEQQLSYQGLVT